MRIPPELAANCEKTPQRAAWLARLPDLIEKLRERWSLTLHSLTGAQDATCSFVAAATRADGTQAVLKVGMPHMEAEHELHGLQFWNGDPTAGLLACDIESHAMLLERCDPGQSALRTLTECEQDIVVTTLLRRLWREPPENHPFRPLEEMLCHWTAETLADEHRWTDAGLVREGLRLFHELPRMASQRVLLATDLHAGNVLSARREPWLAIDPKPFMGDPAYDVCQHLFNCRERLLADPHGLIERVADLAEVDAGRVRLWLFARGAAEPRDQWIASNRTAIALALS